jgi:hypothetical protein
MHAVACIYEDTLQTVRMQQASSYKNKKKRVDSYEYTYFCRFVCTYFIFVLKRIFDENNAWTNLTGTVYVLGIRKET